ncbi:FtsX-like permease family protein [Marispirochaeta aestuarii]|uniref:ABC transporter permease n=1 Tax=Marispirochaeta aestuarii TaxID=1963862 RepID=UPI0029C72F6F|nr:FtsX-like permease family protein [Marispirochaeta aestuarii]
MILSRILLRDLSRRKASLLVVFVFIFLSALMAAGGAGLISDLAGSLRLFFITAKAPHFVQMHGGTLSAAEAEEIASWAGDKGLVEDCQISGMISIDGASLRFSGADEAEINSIMDISLVVQNPRFDYLLDMENRIPEPARGEIGVPVYYARERGVRIGDRITLIHSGIRRDFRVSLLVRDAQMNPAVVHSKRFLMNRADFRELEEIFPDREYLISFRLTDSSRIDEFSEAWQKTGLPKSGPAVDYRIFYVLNSISDGIMAVVLGILSFLLLIIAVLCLRFIILGSIEEDYREIGVMKAVGLPKRTIRRIFLVKYLFISGLAALGGSLASILCKPVLTSNILFSIGQAPTETSRYLVSLSAAAGILLLAFLLLMPVFRRFETVSAVEALRSGSAGDASGRRRPLPLKVFRGINVNVSLGLRDVLQRPRLFALLFLVYFFSALIILIPFHFLTTLASPDFISYMGIGRSDIRIDLRYAGETETGLEELTGLLKMDPEIEGYALMMRSRYELEPDTADSPDDGASLVVESGNHSLFPLKYLEGTVPVSGDELAVSYLNSRDLNVKVGDSLVLKAGDITREMRISGIYQDITNGGRTAKASFTGFPGLPLGYTLALDLGPGIDVQAKAGELGALLPSARVTHLESYLDQTLGSTILQLSRLIKAAIAMGNLIAVLITGLFFRMLAARDAGRIAVMRSIGFTPASVRIQYLSTALILLGTGVAAGSLFANTLGQGFVGFIWGFLGAPGISFVIDPLKAYCMLPLMLMGLVAAAAVLSIAGSLKKTVSVITVE